MCPPGQALDPRKGCSCITIEEKEALTRCGDWKAKDAEKAAEEAEEASKIYLESIVGKYILLWAAENPKYKANKPLNDWQKELFKNLSEEDRNDWPKCTRKFGAELKKIAPRLKKKGVFCKSLGKHGSNVLWEIRVS